MKESLCYSFVMGAGDSIYELVKNGFVIETDHENFRVSFPKSQVDTWEDYIKKHLQTGFWNEYLQENKVIFLFQLEEGFFKYEVTDFTEPKVLKLCEQLCECRFSSLYEMLSENTFYKEILNTLINRK